MAYAGGLGQRMQAQLARADAPQAARLHDFLDARAARSPAGAAAPGVIVRVWIGPDGRLSRLDFASLGDAVADADLRALLLGLAPGPAPPASMPQPVVLRLGLAVPS